MKYLLLCLLLVSCFGNDSKNVKDAEMGTTTETTIDQSQPAEQASAKEQNGFVEENNECICTKEYNPVCGSNGKMYPSPCQAGCEGVTEFTEGECSEEE